MSISWQSCVLINRYYSHDYGLKLIFIETSIAAGLSTFMLGANKFQL